LKRGGGCKARPGLLQRPQGVTNLVSSRTMLERWGIEGDTPVDERGQTPVVDLEYHGAR
jgi:hypothetical protein